MSFVHLANVTHELSPTQEIRKAKEKRKRDNILMNTIENAKGNQYVHKNKKKYE